MLGNIRIRCEFKWAHLLPYQRITVLSAVMAQWLGCRTRNHKVASLSPVTAMSSFGDWFTQP